MTSIFDGILVPVCANVLKYVIQNSDSNDAFIFIHGYNNSFEDAALRTAQLFYDLHYRGAPIMFSWPSLSKTAGYVGDLDQVEIAAPLLAGFLSEIVQKTGARKVNIIAHSMGSKLLALAMEEVNHRYPGVKFNEVIMAAPDINQTIFKNKYAKLICGRAKRLTIYASSNDKALSFSSGIRFSQPRAGQGGRQIMVINGLETIDASSIDGEDYFNHAYFANTFKLIVDIGSVIKLGLPPAARYLEQRETEKGNYWFLKK